MTERITFIDPPIICILGDRGTGKTILSTGLSYLYKKVDELTIFANYHLKGIEYEKIVFEDLGLFPEWLINGVVILDEAHIGADAYEVFKKIVKDITKFSTQLRKRNITMIWTTQRFNTVAKRLRQMTNYIIEVERTDINGVISCKVFDRAKPVNISFIKEFLYDGRQFFNMYDTNEIIEE